MNLFRHAAILDSEHARGADMNLFRHAAAFDYDGARGLDIQTGHRAVRINDHIVA